MLDPGTYRCSSQLRHKLSPPSLGPQKSPTVAGFCASRFWGWEAERYDKLLSEGHSLSEAWSLANYKLFRRHFRWLVLLVNRKVGITFACLIVPANIANRLIRPRPSGVKDSI